MTALVASRIDLLKPSIRVWKQCSCCPYGYHIDLDFVNFCENVVKSQLLPRAVGPSRKPKNRASMQVLLGLSQLHIVKERERAYQPGTWDGLERAVQDFELTLQRASNRPTGIVPKFEEEKETKGDWFNNLKAGVPWRKRTTNKVGQWSGKDVDVCRPITSRWLPKDNRPSNTIDSTSARSTEPHDHSEYDTSERLENDSTFALDTTDGSHISENNSISQETLQHIRQQVASSLSEIKRLEEQVKQVPALQEEITRLTNENSRLSSMLNGVETRPDGLKRSVNDKPEETLPKKRNIAVGTTIVTRDVGVSHKLPLTVTSGTMTHHYEMLPVKPEEKEKKAQQICKPQTSSYCQTEKYYEISLSHRSCQTMLKLDTVYSCEDLERNIDKAIKLYEKTFQHLLHPNKPLLLNRGIQVGSKTSIRRDYGIQTGYDTRNIGVSFKPDSRSSGCQTVNKQIFTRDVGVADDTILETCKKCSVRKTNMSTNTHVDKSFKLMSLGGRSNTFDQLDLYKKSSKSVAVGPDKSVSSSKSTDTRELNIKKDIAVNTTKNKLVDTAVDPMSRPPTSLKRTRSGSKIPRPVHLPIRRTTFSRQDTYLLASSASPSRNSYGSDLFHYESGSEEGTSNFNADSRKSSISLSPDPVFQPIRTIDPHRVRNDVSQEIKGALKVLNDGLVHINDGNSPQYLRNASSIAQQEWFKVSSSSDSDPLHTEDFLDCCEEFSHELLKYIVNMVDSTGNTAMHYAVSHGNFDVVSVLLDSKVCDVNKRNAAGFSCIMLVSLAQVKSISDRQIIRRLFQLADLNMRAKQHGQTALMLAVSHGRMDMVELLLDCGADINIQDQDGSTALMCAAEHGHIDIVKFLLTHPDCDLTITDCDGNTALNIAMEAENRDIGVLLYAQQHFSRGGSPYTSFKSKKPSTTTSRTPTSPLPIKKKLNT